MSTAPLLQRTAQKRIALPVRVEPKVYFANERTFLSWLHFAVVLGGLAVGLLNFGDKVGKISAALYTMVAMGVMVYALVIYQFRAKAIRTRSGAPYDDRLGPTILCICLLAAITTNFVLKFDLPLGTSPHEMVSCVAVQPETTSDTDCSMEGL